MRATTAFFAASMAAVAMAFSGASCEAGGQGTRMPPLDGATGWINSPPLDANALRGKVVVVDFWTYTCINWMRTAPWLRTWAEKYKDAGLVVIGVHSPEFAFEQDPARVRRLHRRDGHALPGGDRQPPCDLAGIPQSVLAGALPRRCAGPDPSPAVRRRRLRQGRGGLPVAAEGSGRAGSRPPSRRSSDKARKPTADWANLKTPETYTGYARTERFASPGGIVRAERHVYTAPRRLRDNQWALAGDWTSWTRVGAFEHRQCARALSLPRTRRARGDGVGDGRPRAHPRDASTASRRVSRTARTSMPTVPASCPSTGCINSSANRRRSKIATIEILFFDRGVELFAFTFG